MLREGFLRGVNLVEPKDRDSNTVCRLCDVTDWESPEFNALACDIYDLGKTKSAMKHRKLWEFTICVKALQDAGLLDDSSAGLSVAAGCERVVYYLAQKVERMIATDIYGASSFSDKESVPEAMQFPERFSPYPYPQERLKMMYMNALALRFPNSLFDFSICLSSIEHFGGVNSAIKAVKEMGRVVRSGGLVVITTECSLNGRKIPDVFTLSEIKQLIDQCGLNLANELKLELTPQTLQHLIDMRHEDVDVLPHLNLRAYAADFTSICLVFRKPGETNLTDLEKQQRREFLDTYTSLKNALFADETDAAGKRHPVLERCHHAFRSYCLRCAEYSSLETWLFRKDKGLKFTGKNYLSIK